MPMKRSCQIASHLNPVKIKILISSKSSIKGDLLYISGTRKGGNFDGTSEVMLSRLLHLSLRICLWLLHGLQS